MIGATTFRITDCDVPIAAGGFLYEPRGLKIPSFQYTEKAIVDSVTIQIDNLDRLFTSAFVGGAPQGSPVFLRQVYLDADYRPIGAASTPLVWLRLSDGWGEVAGDSTGADKKWNITGTALWTDAGPNGQGSLNLDGSTQYAVAPDNNVGDFTTEDYTVAFFIKPAGTQAGGNRRIVSKANAAVDGWEIFAQDDYVTLRHYASSTQTQKRHSGTTLAPETLQVDVIQSADDGSRRPGWTVGENYHWVGYQTAWGSYHTAWRWQDVQIPQGAQIVSAYLRVYLNGVDVATKIELRGIDEDDTADLTVDPITRDQTTAFADFSGDQWDDTADGLQNSPDFAAVIQEIVGRSGWDPGNSLGIVARDNGSADGDIFNTIGWDFDVHQYAPELHIEYVVGEAWHSVVVIRKGTEAELYIDNVRKAWNSIDDSLDDPSSNTTYPLTLGNRANLTSYYWGGEVADLIICDRAMRRSEVAAYHAGTFVGPATGPVGYWKVDEGIDAEIIDSSGTDKHGAIVGSPVWVSDQDRQVLEMDDLDERINLFQHDEHKFLGDFTFSCWLYFNLGTYPGAGNFVLFDNEIYQQDGVMWRINGTTGDLTFRTSNTGTHSDAKGAATVVPLEQWVHLAVRWRAGKAQHFMDGGANGAAGFNDAPAKSTSVAVIGRNQAADFNARLANFQMYDRGLTDSEIEEIYNQGLYGIAGPGVLTLFEGGLDAWTLNDKMLKIGAKSEMARWTQKPLSLHSVSCRWKQFKGTECGYAGEGTWCDRTYTRCEDLGNAPNFGGFRWLPSIMDKEIWWGKIPK